jgi:hypothetical protein
LSVTLLKKNPIVQNWWQWWDPCPIISKRKILLEETETLAHPKRKPRPSVNATPSYHLKRKEEERSDSRWQISRTSTSRKPFQCTTVSRGQLTCPCFPLTRAKIQQQAEGSLSEWKSLPESPLGITNGKAKSCILQGHAQLWWDSLEVFQTNKEDWATVKASFLKSFEPKYSAKTVCANLQDLNQKSCKGVFAYLKNIEAFKQFMATKPDKMPQAVAAMDNHKSDWIATERSMMQHFQTQLFIACIQDKIQKELMKNTYDNFQAMYKAALDLKVIQHKNKMAKPVTVGCRI